LLLQLASFVMRATLKAFYKKLKSARLFICNLL
jgi:hypothetical protein